MNQAPNVSRVKFPLPVFFTYLAEQLLVFIETGLFDFKNPEGVELRVLIFIDIHYSFYTERRVYNGIPKCLRIFLFEINFTLIQVGVLLKKSTQRHST
jgi:hypothetical protein